MCEEGKTLNPKDCIDAEHSVSKPFEILIVGILIKPVLAVSTSSWCQYFKSLHKYAARKKEGKTSTDRLCKISF